MHCRQGATQYCRPKPKHSGLNAESFHNFYSWNIEIVQGWRDKMLFSVTIALHCPHELNGKHERNLWWFCPVPHDNHHTNLQKPTVLHNTESHKYELLYINIRIRLVLCFGNNSQTQLIQKEVVCISCKTPDAKHLSHRGSKGEMEH